MEHPLADDGHAGATLSLAALRRELDAVCSRDAHRLRQRWSRLSREPDAAKLARLAADIERSVARRAARVAAKPTITLDPALPISARADDIVGLIAKHQVVVIAGETGSGKTTQLPKLCLAAGRGEAGMIGCTQPRRLAARSMARRVAQELHVDPGGVVGYEVRFGKQLSERTLVKFMTDGILLAETQGDPWLAAYDTLIIDEAHERSLNIDFLLGYLKRLAARRPDLKIIVTSATIDTARFAAHFGGAPVVQVEGRAYPVEVRWRDASAGAGGHAPAARGKDPSPAASKMVADAQPEQQIAAVLDEITREDPRGDVLVFLPGEREIRDAHLALSRRAYRATEILPLYARLSAKEQDRVFSPGAQRRIVLATNVAETSLTVPRIRYVIDTGTARVKRYSRRTQIERLHVEPISRAAADQRKGRCGRVGPGICYRLYSEGDFAARPEFTDPELLRSSLANVILRMLALKLGAVDEFPFLDPPDPRVVADGYRRLAEIGAIDGDRHLTAIGRRLAGLPVDVQLARMLVEAERLGCVRDVLVIVSFLSVQDPRERLPSARAQADAAHRAYADPTSDFTGVIRLWRAYRDAHEAMTQSRLRDWCARQFVGFLRMREWGELHRQLREMAVGSAAIPAAPDVPDSSSVARCLLSGLPTQVGRRNEKGIYLGPRERKFHVFPGSALAKSPPNWIFSAQILDVGSRVWGMMNARVDPLWIEQQAAHLLHSTCRDPHWSRKRGAVVAFQQVSLFGLVLADQRTVMFQEQDPALAHGIFLRDALVRGDVELRGGRHPGRAGAAGAASALDCLRANRRVLDEAHELEARERRGDLVRSDEELVAFFAGKLPESIASLRAFEAWYRRAAPAEQAALRWSADDVLAGAAARDAAAFPGALELPLAEAPAAGGAAAKSRFQRFRLEYRFLPGDDADGVTLHVPLALLNALPTRRCEWLVPGLLADKVAELIRGLPKNLRRNFVPAPDFARAFVEAEAPRDEALVAALAAFLFRRTGVAVGAADFDPEALPAHFRMRYSLHAKDDAGRPKVLGASRDLAALRRTWQGQARAAFADKVDIDLPRVHAESWDFGDLPAQVRTDGGLPAFPALVDLGDAVALRVFERSADALAAHRAGVTRLLRNGLAGEFRAIERRLPVGKETALRHAALGSAAELRRELVAGGFADWLQDRDLDVRTADGFSALCDACRHALSASAMARLAAAEPIIAAHAELAPWMRPPRPGQSAASYADLREQLDALLAPGFLRDLPLARLAHYPRYLHAMRVRAGRLRQDPAKDRQRMLQVLPYWRAWLARSAEGADAAALDELRWLIEEWRVSLFAQELRTAEPVSAKRLAAALAKLG